MKFLKLGSDIDIFEENPETEENRMYLSRIEEIREQSILITPPFIKGSYSQFLQVDMGKALSLRLAAEGCSYFFECELIACDETSNSFWEISLPTNFRRIQRREYVRLAIILDVRIEYIDKKKNIIKAFTKDISAGGVRVVLEEPLPNDLDIKISLPLTDEFVIETKGEIVRVIFPETPRGMVTTAIRFNEILQDEQEELTKYIFQQEVQRRQKDKYLFGKSIR